MTRSLEGRAAIVTGANQGLGLAIARAYVDAGAHVALCARNEDKLAGVAAELRERSGAAGRVVAVRCDVSVEADVQALVDAALHAFGRLDVLVNNAGVYGPFGPLEDVDWAEWARAIEINVHGSVLPMRAVLPHFKAQRHGKIVQVSGGGATNPLPRITAYAASKAAIVRLAESVALDVAEYGIDVNAIAPGALDTRMLDQVLEAGPDRVGRAFYERMVEFKGGRATPVDVGAALAVFLGSRESDGITGRLISAPWDPWRDLPSHRDDLARSDVYTLRRIQPKDRGMAWGE